jgi:hypothetical protein
MKRRLFLTGLLGVTGTALCGAQIAPPKPEVFGISKELMDHLQRMRRLDSVVDDKSQLWYAPAGCVRGRLKAMELSWTR